MGRRTRPALIITLLAGGALALWSTSDDGMRRIDDIASVTTGGAPLAVALGKSSEPPRPLTQETTRRERDRAAVIPQIQRELARVGCLTGPIDGIWSEVTRVGIQAFGEHISAAIAADTPDHVLLTLLQGFRGTACAYICPAGMTAGSDGICRAPQQTAAVVEPPTLPQPLTPAAKESTVAKLERDVPPPQLKPAATRPAKPPVDPAAESRVRIKLAIRAKPERADDGLDVSGYISRPDPIGRPTAVAVP